jgi:exosortase/archaeosortase
VPVTPWWRPYPGENAEPGGAVGEMPQDQTVLGIRWVAGVIGGGALAFWALVIFGVLSSAFDTDPATDPHGYGIVFGVLIAVPVSLFWALVLPFAAPKRRWGRAFAVSLPALLALNALVFWALSVSGAG